MLKLNEDQQDSIGRWLVPGAIVFALVTLAAHLA